MPRTATAPQKRRAPADATVTVCDADGLPWRTASQSAFSEAVSRKAAQLYVDPFVRQLQPKVIVAVGKKAAEMLEYAGHLSEAVVVWNRARALRPSVVADREAAAKKFSVLLSAL